MNVLLYKIYRRTIIGNWIRNLNHKVQEFIPDKIFISRKYRSRINKPLQLTPPRTLNEKINWLKLYNRNNLQTQCADKYAVRDIIADTIGEQYLVPLYFVTKRPEDIVPENIGEIPCIIKTNHDSSGGIFVYGKDNVDWKKVQKQLKERLKKNYYNKSREWQYKNIDPCIIVEKLLQNHSGDIPDDYKFHCFNGRVRMISVDLNRGTDNHNRNWFNRNWEREPYKWSSKKSNGSFTDPREEGVEQPKTLEKMIFLSEKLAATFDYVRVDWYDVDGRLYFGEITFHHDGGYRPILPEEWDLRLGQELQISQLKEC